MHVPAEIRDQLTRFGQTHLLHGWVDLSETRQREFLDQLAELDFDLLERLFALRSGADSSKQTARSRAARAEPPAPLVRLPQSAVEHTRWRQAADRGRELLSQGKVACLLVAGGQGSRLGFDLPKGMFPIGPLSERTLFDWLCGQVVALSQQTGGSIPYLIMTSEATHDDTIRFFEARHYLGLRRDDVFFFRQRSLPAVDDEQPRLLLDEPGRLSTSPDGHGGMLHALHASGLLNRLLRRGIEHVYYHQVDNPTAIVCDPAFLGLHLEETADVSTKVVAKAFPLEKMGVVVSIDGHAEIIEYSDLTPEQQQETLPDGSLRLWAGNTAMHVFRTGFLQELVDRGIDLPYHVAHKPVPYWDPETSRRIEPPPTENTAHKFEQFIFDVLPEAGRALVVEADRAREFNPVKNADGNDSPETCRSALLRIHREWLVSAGAEVGPETRVEIPPDFALDADQVQARVPRGTAFTEDTILLPEAFPFRPVS